LRLFSTSLLDASGKVRENQTGLKLNETYHLHAYSDLNLLGDIIYTIKKNIETFIDAIKEVHQEVNPKKTKLKKNMT
jgi:hypothetical protein